MVCVDANAATGGAAEKIFQGVLTESVAEAAKYLPIIAEVAATSQEFYSVNRRWPANHDELISFARDRGVQLDLSEFVDLKITPVGNGEHARISYVIRPKNAKGELKGEVELPQSVR